MMSLDELEIFFQQQPVPEGTMLNAAAKIVEPDKFIKVNLDNARRWKGDIHKCPNYWHLCDLHRLVSTQAL